MTREDKKFVKHFHRQIGLRLLEAMLLDNKTPKDIDKILNVKRKQTKKLIYRLLKGKGDVYASEIASICHACNARLKIELVKVAEKENHG